MRVSEMSPELLPGSRQLASRSESNCCLIRLILSTHNLRESKLSSRRHPDGSSASPPILDHSTHAHSAWAVVAQASRDSATSSETFRASQIIGRPPRAED